MRRALAFFAAAALVSCNAVFGFDKAELDPELASPGTTSPGGISCDSYCADIMKNCTGDNAEYTSAEVCKAMCLHLEPGVASDRSQDSLACRAYHASVAGSDPGVHCRHAGPLGGGVCGDDPCAPYCLLDVALCATQPTPPFAGESECRQACAKFTYVANASDLTMMTGDTLNCRLYHLESAYEVGNPVASMTHCPHTGVVSATCQ